MKEKLKTALIIILLILSTCLIIIGCKTNRFRFILPGYSIRSTSVIHYRDNCDLNRFTEQFLDADSLFYEKYELPLTH